MDVRLPNIRHLRVFNEVAKCKSISIAANRIHLSQPAVTQAISNLEGKLGVALFMRKNAGFQTTETGEMFRQRVERALAYLKAGARQCRIREKGVKTRGFSNFEELVTSAQIRALVAVAEARNFSIAATNIGLSQPSVHRAARNLESLSGVTLFEKISSGIMPTPAAEAFIKYVKLANAEIHQGVDEISLFNGQNTTVITVGSLPLPRSHVLPLAVNAMLQSAPGVQIQVIDGPYATLIQRLRSGEIDCIIGALRDPAPADDVVQEQLFSDPLAIVSGKDHPLVGATEIGVQDLLAYPWLAPPKSAPAGKYLFDFLRIEDLEETPVRVISSSLIFLRGLLAQGNYLTIISRHQIREEVLHGSLVPLPIELANSARPIGITVRQDWRPTEMQSRFMAFLRKFGGEVDGENHT
ncbi:MAG: LysR family transcriptional regulator [Rhodobacteraceae bacterium]|nr:LysR family transcriptional regulator [Paracoccaceae bacterium]